MFTAAFIEKIEREERVAAIVETLDRQSTFLVQLSQTVQSIRTILKG